MECQHLDKCVYLVSFDLMGFLNHLSDELQYGVCTECV